MSRDARSKAVDRRSLLKAGAAAGAAAWVAPTLTAQPAWAQGDFCTPKCYGSTRPVAGTSFIQCGPTGSDPGRKWVGFSFELIGDCPCSDDPPIVSNVAYTGLNKVPGGALQEAPEIPTTIVTNPTTGAITVTSVFRGNGTGAVGTGTVTGTVAWLVTCTDQDGTVVKTQCVFTFEFDWQPADGNCGSVTNLGPANISGQGCINLPCGS